MNHSYKKPWLDSDPAWLTAQSLCIHKIRSMTLSSKFDAHKQVKKKLTRSLSTFDQSIITSIALREDFGFTTGATPALMKCITDTTLLAERMSDPELSQETLQSEISSLELGLRNCHIDNNNELAPPVDSPTRASAMSCHRRIFASGAWIYFYRRIMNLKPAQLQQHVSTLLRDLECYPHLGGGRITTWPVFMAAMEVYRNEDKARIVLWLDDARHNGVADRAVIRALMEDVWSTRTRLSKEGGIDEGEIVVDWTKFLQQRKLDLLLA